VRITTINVRRFGGSSTGPWAHCVKQKLLRGGKWGKEEGLGGGGIGGRNGPSPNQNGQEKEGKKSGGNQVKGQNRAKTGLLRRKSWEKRGN